MKSPSKTAQYLLQNYWDRRLPIDLNKIIASIQSKLGAKNNLSQDNALLKPGMSGQLSFDGSRYVISINQNDSLTRQRFTLAHELGHYMLGHGERFDNSETLYRGGAKYTFAEIEANSFAAELLMPEPVVRYLLFDENLQTIAQLSDVFLVSEQAMRYRLKNLGLI